MLEIKEGQKEMSSKKEENSAHIGPQLIEL